MFLPGTVEGVQERKTYFASKPRHPARFTLPPYRAAPPSAARAGATRERQAGRQTRRGPLTEPSSKKSR